MTRNTATVEQAGSVICYPEGEHKPQETVGISVRECYKESITAFELCWETCEEGLRKQRFVSCQKMGATVWLAKKAAVTPISPVRRMFVKLWVLNDLAFVCGLDVSQQFTNMRCYFLSQKEHLIGNENITSTDQLSTNLQIKENETNFGGLLLCQISFSIIAIHLT